MKTRIIFLMIILALVSFAFIDPNPYMARTSCNYNVIAWKSPPSETDKGWVYLVTLSSVTVIEGNKRAVDDTQYWIANATGLIDLTETYIVQGAVQVGGATIWTEQVQMTCPKIYLPQTGINYGSTD